MSGVACYAIFGLVVAAFGFVLLFVGRDDKKTKYVIAKIIFQPPGECLPHGVDVPLFFKGEHHVPTSRTRPDQGRRRQA